MSPKYNPVLWADPTWAVASLSERDISDQVPINFVTVPALSLTSACFGNKVYATDTAAKCMSNVLAAGYRRIFVDIYWSAERRQWIFCPVTIPQDGSKTASTSGATNDTSVKSSSGPPLHQLGGYSCTDGLDLSVLFDILVGYFGDNYSDLEIHVIYIVFNLHAAASSSTPDTPPSTVTGSQLPTRSQFVGPMALDALGSYIFKPSHLAKDRSNVDQTWFRVPTKYKPVTEYFTIRENHNGKHTSPDGWPCSKYIQYASQRRLLLEYGSVDPELQDYDPMRDNDVVFSPGYMTSSTGTYTADSRLKSGCLFQPDASTISEVNSSWIQSNPVPVPRNSNTTQALAQLSHSVQNMTTCGLSPMLNSTLFNATADGAMGWYRNISHSAIWSWAIGEPKGANLTDRSPGFKEYRCALMDMSLSGHWRASNCSEKRYAACRVKGLPFNWTLTNKEVSFSDASDACSGDSSFEAPRTGLENMYLYNTLLAQSKEVLDPSSDSATKREVWLDLNSIDVQSCWVNGGADVRCPYNTGSRQVQRKTVVVAAVASIIIFTITALTIFVKCNSNRRVSRRRKRVIGGWEYEGVPS